MRFNISELVGNALERDYPTFIHSPPEELNLSNILQNWATQTEAAALHNVIREFWLDIRHKILRQKQ